MGINNKLSQFNSYSWKWKAGWLIVCFLAGVWLSSNIPFIVALPKGMLKVFPSLIGRLVARGLTGVIIGAGLFLLSVWLVSLKPGTQRRTPVDIKVVFRYALLMIAVWLVFFLAYYPGMMSADSLYQWKQMLTGNYTNQHPPFHTLTIWLLTRIYLSPATVALAQILALALVAGAVLGFIQSLGAPFWLPWIAALIFAISPVNGTMVNTLWKDVPFSISVLGLTLLLGLIIRSDGEWLTKYRNAFLLGLVSALVLLFRYDGFPLGAGALLLVLIAYPQKWQGWLRATVICAVLYIGVTGPFYKAVGVKPEANQNNPQQISENVLSLYTVSLYTKPELPPMSILRRATLISGNCKVWSKLKPQWEQNIDPSISFSQIASNAVRNLPIALLYDYRCRRSMEWIIYDPYGDVYNPSHAEYWIDANPFGIVPDSKLPALREYISAWVSRTAHNPKLSWLIWRPALYLYLFLFVVFMIVLRTRCWKYLLMAAPVLIQSVLFTLIPLAPNFRYHYAVYLVSMIYWPLLFAGWLDDEVGNGAKGE